MNHFPITGTELRTIFSPHRHLKVRKLKGGAFARGTANYARVGVIHFACIQLIHLVRVYAYH